MVVEYGDIDGEGASKLYFHGKDIFVLIHGEVATPIIVETQSFYFSAEFSYSNCRGRGPSGNQTTCDESMDFSGTPTLFDDLTEEQLSSAPLTLLKQGQDYHIGDFDGDGDQDILLDKSRPIFFGRASTTNNEVNYVSNTFLIRGGANAFDIQTTKHPAISGFATYSVSDVDNDGRDDLVSAQGTHNADAILAEVARVAAPSIDDIPDARFSDGVVPASDTVAVIPGQAAVQGGYASYAIPIGLPPGRRGLQPSVSLSYSSRNSRGSAGAGWSLNAGGRVHRCAGIWELDGESARFATYKDSDKLCLNGERLILASGTYGKSGATYYPETSLSTKVTQSADIGSSDSQFTAFYADGTKEYFGENSNSRDRSGGGFARSWLITRRLDPFNNNIIYRYISHVGVFYLSDIYYTGSDQTRGNRRVRIEYENRPDIVMSYVADKKIVDGYRIDKIQTYLALDLIATYDLEYADTSNEPGELTNEGLVARKSFLRKITLRRGDETAKETLIDWHPLTSLVSGINHATPTMTMPRNAPSIYSFSDYDGDGVNDIFAVNTDAGDATLEPQIHLSSQNKWVKLSALGFADAYQYKNNSLGSLSPDFTGDGRSEVLGYRRKKITSAVRFNEYYLSFANWNGDSFDVTETNIDITCLENELISDIRKPPVQCGSYVADLNQDGLDDFIAVHSQVNIPSDRRSFDLIRTIYYRDKNCDGKTAGDDCAFGFRKGESGNFIGREYSTQLLDFDNDGRVDTDADGWPILYGGGSKRYSDLNGDGLVDIFRSEAIAFGTGSGSISKKHNILVPKSSVYIHPVLRDPRFDEKLEFRVHPIDFVQFIDIDKDGLMDVLVPREIVKEAASLGASYCYFFRRCDKSEHESGDLWRWDIWVARTSANGDINYTKLRDTPAIYGALSGTRVMDIDGDGWADIVSNIRANYTTNTLPARGIHVYSNQRSTADLVERIDNGLVSHTFKYAALNEGQDIYKVDYQSPLASPYTHFNNGLTVVKKYTTDNGIGGERHTSYSYQNASFHKAGRGFQGFGSIEVVDAQKGLKTRSDFAQFFPFTGRPTYIEVRSISDNKLISSNDNIWACKLRHLTSAATTEVASASGMLNDELTKNYIKGVYKKTRTARRYQLGGTRKVSEARTEMTLDGYGNTRFEASTETDTGWLVSTAKRSSAYAPADTANWRVAKLEATLEKRDIRYDDPLGLNAAQTRQATGMQYTYNSGNSYQLDALETCMPSYSSTVSGNLCQDSNEFTLKNTYTYDGFGNQKRSTRSSRNTLAGKTDIDGVRWTETDYSSDGYFARTNKNSEWGTGHIASEQIVDAATGLVATAKDANGLITTTQYNGFGIPLVQRFQTTQGKLFAPSLYTQTLWCDTSCPKFAVSKRVRRQAGQPDTVEYIDRLGRVIETQTKTLTSSLAGSQYRQQITQNTYNALGYMTRERQYRSDNTALSIETRYSDFDVLGRARRKVVDRAPVNYTVDYVFDGLTSHMTVTGGAKTLSMQYSKSSQGWMLAHTNTDDKTTSFRYDGAGNPIKLRDVLGNDINTVYNSFGQKTRVEDPNAGATTFSYNALGELKWQKDANGDAISLKYDRLGRQISRTPTKGLASTWTYDPVQNARTHYGMVGGEGRGAFSRVFHYDGLSRVIKNVTDTDGKVFTEQFAYDSHFNRVKGRLLDDGSLIESRYDAGTGVLVAEYDVVRGKTMYQAQTWDASGGVATASYGNGLHNMVDRYISGQVKSMCTTSGKDCSVAEQSVQHLIYENQRQQAYDAFGNLLGTRDLKGGFWETYDYDSQHRLTENKRHRQAVKDTKTYLYTYDAAGNLTQKSDYASRYFYGNSARSAGGKAGPNAVRGINKVDGGSASFQYDSNGNMLSGDGRSLDYDLNNKPTSITKGSTTTTFYYDANGMRYKQIEKNGNKTTITHYGGNTEYLVIGSKVESRTTIGDWGLHIVKSDGQRQLRYVHRDRLGSMHTLSDAALDAATFGGEMVTVERRAFDVFGKVLGTSDSDDLNWQNTDLNSSPRGFTGHEHLQPVGLIHMNGRAYDPLLGRFLSVDPFIQSPENSQSFNPYSYVMNNPLAGVDPSGYASSAAENQAAHGNESTLNVTSVREVNGVLVAEFSDGTQATVNSITVIQHSNGSGGEAISTTYNVEPPGQQRSLNNGSSRNNEGMTTEALATAGSLTGIVEHADTHPIWVGKNGQVKANNSNYSGNQYNGSKAGQIAKAKEIAKKLGIPLAVASSLLRGVQLPGELTTMRTSGASQRDITLQKVDAGIDIAMAGVGVMGLPGFAVAVGYTVLDYSSDNNASKALINGVQNIPVPPVPKAPDRPGGMKSFMHRLFSVPEFDIGQ